MGLCGGFRWLSVIQNQLEEHVQILHQLLMAGELIVIWLHLEDLGQLFHLVIYLDCLINFSRGVENFVSYVLSFLTPKYGFIKFGEIIYKEL